MSADSGDSVQGQGDTILHTTLSWQPRDPDEWAKTLKAAQQGIEVKAGEAARDCLMVVYGNRDLGRVYPLTKPTHLIGRKPPADIVLAHREVSSRHAEITRGPDGAVEMEDLDSSNGTAVNDTTIKERTRLATGDIVRIGRCIGKATLDAGAPRCLPTVLVTVYEKDIELAELGAFCGRGSVSSLMRFRVGGMLGSLTPEDTIKIGAALKSPVDK
jgi:hypothetical protein